jgi:hypothetical protein
MEYFAGHEDAPVKSLGEILERGLFHSELEATFRARNAPETRETEATRRARIKQATLRQVTDAVLREQRLDALLYPTLRRRPARIGDAQSGTNCSLSAHSGLPALSVPAGFTADGVPIGMEFLGAAFSEHTLLSLGYATEQLLKTRQAPFSTPALVRGKAPAARRTRARGHGASVELTYDETTSRLRFTVTADARQRTGVAAIWLHSGTEGKVGAARHRLFSDDYATTVSQTGTTSAPRTDGEVRLSAGDRRDLQAGNLSVRFYPRGGGESVTVHLPEMRSWQ